MYAVTANVETVAMGTGDREWRGSRQVPTFYLDEATQGIVSPDHAERIAREIIDPLNEIPAERIHVRAVYIGVTTAHA